MLVRLLWVLSFSLLLSFGLLAEPDQKKPITDKPAEDLEPLNLAPLERRLYELALLDLEMQNARGIISNDPNKNVAMLIVALEPLVRATCLPYLSKDLKYAGPPQGTKCIQFLEQLEKVDQNNPVATCARFGTDSESCKDAFDQQYIHSRSYDLHGVDTILVLNPDLEAGIYSGTYRKPGSEIDVQSLARRLKESPTPENKKAYEDRLRFDIATRCKDAEIYYTTVQPEESMKANFKPEVVDDSELSRMIKDFGKTTKTDNTNDALARQIQEKFKAAGRKDVPLAFGTPDPDGEKAARKKIWRVRAISDNCSAIVTTALDYDLLFPEAICFREGFLSPTCHHALQNQIKSQEKNKPKKSNKSGAGDPLFKAF